jgi:shikimate dehydrogenase
LNHKLGLVGRNISHSKSKKVYEKILGKDVDYSLLDYPTEYEIPTLDEIFSGGLIGLSITSPYKGHFIDQVVIDNKFVNNMGIINCIKKSDEKYFATNTDYLAIEVLLSNYLKEHSAVTILGNGMMARVCISILNILAMPYKQYSRSVDGAIDTLDLALEDKKVLVINSCSRDYVFNGKLGVMDTFWDMNYSFDPHANNLKKKCNYEDGLELLTLQGRFAVDFWNIS